MSRIEERVDTPFVLAVAHQVLDHHDRGGTCQCCTPDGCRQTEWARDQIADHRARRAAGVR
ncbi:MAG TPA: hypothetical protein VF174_08045 [Micromonosporaceae bacterium]